MDQEPALDGVDGRLFLEAEGIRFERSRMSAAGRHVDQVHRVPWSAIAGAGVDRGTLRVQVAGAQAPRLSTSDPNAIALRRGQDGAQLVDEISSRAAGGEARPVLEGNVVDEVVDGPGSRSVPPRSAEEIALQRLDRVYKWQGRLLSFQLVMWAIAAAALAVIVVLVAVVLIF